ncbi:hypothetical protein [Raoultella terrigena]|uniref:hypothetical protein n=1 Tax=Raoultella terrigena TaxID=577 RepID=UPI001F2A4114|nr:hypothetical protein [Raoultella terrigena]
MCGRFAQSQTQEEYLAYLAEEADPKPGLSQWRSRGRFEYPAVSIKLTYTGLVKSF